MLHKIEKTKEFQYHGYKIEIVKSNGKWRWHITYPKLGIVQTAPRQFVRLFSALYDSCDVIDRREGIS